MWPSKHCMSTKGNDTCLSLRPYEEAVDEVRRQFEFVRFALRHLSRNRMVEFFRQCAADEIAGFKRDLAWVKAQLPADRVEELTQIEDVLLKHKKSEARRRSRPADVRFRVEFSEDRLNQSELLLSVAHFESFLKLAHRTFLQACPTKVFGSRDKEIPLREIFDPTCSHLDTDRFLNELIFKEVKWLDSQNIERKAEYFQKYFGISFGQKREIAELKEIMNLRNKISHEAYVPPPKSPSDVQEQPLISEKMLKRARRFFIQIPKECVKVGVKSFPRQFRYA